MLAIVVLAERLTDGAGWLGGLGDVGRENLSRIRCRRTNKLGGEKKRAV